MINMLYTEKKQSYEQKPEWHFLWEGCFSEMPEECNNIIYNYIIFFHFVKIIYIFYKLFGLLLGLLHILVRSL